MTTTTMPGDLDTACCSEAAEADQRGLGRRGFLRGLGVAGGVAAFGSTLVTASPASAFVGTGSDRVLVVLSLRGAADGLSLVVPHADKNYYAARPTIAIASDRLLAKDGFFGLHPSFAPLMPLWTSGRMAAIHATGMPVANRSHFAAMELIEDADPGTDARVGWLNRLIGLDENTSALQAIAVGSRLPTALAGDADALAMNSVDTMIVKGAASTAATDPRMASLAASWRDRTDPLSRSMRLALGAVKDFEPARKTPASTTVTYPTTGLGQAMGHIARTVRSGVVSNVFTVDQGNWDHHQGLGTADTGRMVTQVTELAGALAAFFADLGPLAEKVTVVTISEFGRRVQENSSGGLDHGYGNVMLALGGGVKGGYFGRWPGLGTALDSDLTVTTDYRHVLSEIVAKRFGVSTAKVFPGFTATPVGFMA